MSLNRSIILFRFSMIALLGWFAQAAPVGAQQQGRCGYCAWFPCNGQLGAVCDSGAVRTSCSRSQSDNGCYLTYTETPAISCGGDAAQACKPSSTSVLPVGSQESAKKTQGQTITDEEMQADLIKSGRAAAKTEWQPSDPIMFTYSEHHSDDMLAVSKVLNLSKNTISAIRIGWTIKTPGEANETKLGDWVVITGALQPDGLLPDGIISIPAQKIDTAPLWKVGTVVKLYVAQVRFEDGSIWQRIQENKADQKKDTKVSMVIPVFPGRTSRIVDSK
jgi:hypothetical protein